MKIKTLQSLRFLFMTLIVLFHIVGKDFEFGGDCGVSFFFMLSGFVLSYSNGQKMIDGQFQLLSFLKKQLIRFYPLHILTLAVMILLEARLGRYYDWYQLLPSIFLLQSWFPFERIIEVGNASSWFLCDLLFFYVMFPTLYKCFYRLAAKWMAVCGVVFLAVYIVIVFSVPLQKVNYVVCLSPVMRVMDFSIGILIARLCLSAIGESLSRYLQSLHPLWVTAVELIPVALVFLSYFVYVGISPRLRCVSLFWLVLPPLLFIFIKADGLRGMVTSLLHQRSLVWLGGISLEIYLTHWPVMRMMNSILHSLGIDTYMPQFCIVLLTLLVFIVTASLTRRFFVEPVRQRLLVCI